MTPADSNPLPKSVIGYGDALTAAAYSRDGIPFVICARTAAELSRLMHALGLPHDAARFRPARLAKGKEATP